MHRVERVSWFVLIGYFATWATSYGWDFNHPIGIILDVAFAWILAWLSIAIFSHNRRPLAPDTPTKRLRPTHGIHNAK